MCERYFALFASASLLSSSRFCALVIFPYVEFLSQAGANEWLERWTSISNFMQMLTRKVTTVVTTGNHDLAHRNVYANAWLAALAPLGVNATRSRRYYSLDWGRVHIVVIDTVDNDAPLRLNSRQSDWLIEDLANAHARVQAGALDMIWLLGHSPPFALSAHGSNYAIRAFLAPLLSQYRVSLAIWGHEHVFERTHFIAADGSFTSDPAQQLGADGKWHTMHLVVGSGGALIRHVLVTISFFC